jgi:flagella basal body P-ring formation protein FlgA
VPTAKVLEAIRLHNLFAIDTGGLGEVEVTRAGRLITAAQIEERVLRVLAGQYGLADAGSLHVTFDHEVEAITVEPSVTAELQVARARVEPRSGRFEIVLDLPGSTLAGRKPLRLTGAIAQFAETTVLTRPLARGEVVKTADVAIEKRRKTEVPADAVAPGEQIVGLAARQALRAGQPLRRADLMKPQIVKRDDTVTLVYEVPGLLLTTRGKALDAGAEDDVIGVLNLQSKRKVQGTVAADGRVLMAAHPRLVAAAASVPPTAEIEPTAAHSEQ